MSLFLPSPASSINGIDLVNRMFSDVDIMFRVETDDVMEAKTC